MAMSSRGKHLKICAGRNLVISELPDDILVHVLSFLTMKEAGRTSVLSKRWKHLWAYIPTLDFDSRKIIEELELGTKSLEVEDPMYLHWVDQVISSHKAPTIDEFRVWFDVALNENSRSSIDNWLRFAMEKRVKRLEMGLCVPKLKKCPNRPLRYYTFPSSLSCNSLTSLDLASVGVTGQVIESFLCNCLGLEYLSVKYSKSLVELTVAGPLLNLKSLSIFRCLNIKKLEISAPNLVSVCYFGPKINVQFKSTPKLAQVSIGYRYADDLVHSFLALSSYLSQIEVLSLSPFAGIERIRISIKDPVFSRLRKLDVSVSLDLDDNLFFFGSLIKVCPFLRHFKLQLNVTGQKWKVTDGLRKPEACPHNHLKIVEIVGFVGEQIDLEIAAFLIETTVSLDKLILDPCQVYELVGSPREFDVRRARMRAEGIRTNLKPGTKLEIL